MSAQIGAIAPYQEFADSLQQVADRLGVPIVMAVAAGDEAAHIAREWEREGQVRVVLAHEKTASRIKAVTELFVVALRHAAMDVLSALREARPILQRSGHTGPTVIIQAARLRHYDPFALGQTMGITVTVLEYQSELEWRPYLERARDLDAPVVVCDDAALTALAAAHHLPSVLIAYGPDALRLALEQALDRLRFMRWERGRDSLARVLFELTGQGMVVANSKGVITAVSGSAERLLGIRTQVLVGLTLTQAASRYAQFAHILQDGNEAAGELVTAGDTPMVVDRRPVEADGEPRGLVISFQPASQIERLEGRIRKKLYSQGLVARHSFADLVGQSQVLRQLIARTRQFAHSDLSVLIIGESGTGKELFAQSIHRESPRRDGPFVAVNCAALPESLLESELFGYEDGAFTGARKGGKPGLFELAHGGTIFLDEVGELPLHLQARMLRVLEVREVMRLGGDRIVPVDVRIIAATNRDLDRAVADGVFRADLYYRLGVLILKVPPLRQRREDIGLLCRHFLATEAQRQAIRVPELTAAMVAELQDYDWPGNVRELANVVRRFLLLSASEPDPAAVLRALLAELPAHRTGADPAAPEAGEDLVQVRIGPLEEMIGRIIIQLRETRGWDQQELAQRLGISRTSVWKRLKRARAGG